MTFVRTLPAMAVALLLGASPVFAQTAAPAPDMSHAAAVETYARAFLKTWGDNAKLKAAIAASTKTNSKLSYDETQTQDWRWQLARAKEKTDEKSVAAAKRLEEQLAGVAPETTPAENLAAGKAEIAAIRGNAISTWLKDVQAKAPKGAVTEIFVMDGAGWNVGQTGGTSDFFQGDEGKWQKTFAAGDPKEIEILPVVEEDGMRISQVSLPIKSGEESIGAVTIGVDVDKVK
jgi:hypothetical protein